MNLKSVATSFALLFWVAPAAAVTHEPAGPLPGIVTIAANAERITVFHLAPNPSPKCGSLPDSLRYTQCYPVLEQASAPDDQWSKDLGLLLGTSRMIEWNRDSCGYTPAATVRFAEVDRISNLIVLTGNCDTSRVGLVMIRPGTAMQYRELRSGGEDLLDMLAYALAGAQAEPPRPVSESIPVDPMGEGSSGYPSEGEFVYYDEEPVVIQRVQPVYPEFAKVAQIQGKVTLHVLVDETGRVVRTTVIHGVTGLNEAAVEAVKRWVFRPATDRGKPVAVWVEVPMDFHF